MPLLGIWLPPALGAILGALVLRYYHPSPRWPIWLFFFPLLLIGLSFCSLVAAVSVLGINE